MKFLKLYHLSLALLVAKNPNLTVDDITRLFSESADRDLQPSGIKGFYKN